MIHLTGKRMNDGLMKGISAGARRTVSENGWSTTGV